MRIYLGIPFYGGAGSEFVSSLLKLHVCLHLAKYEVEVDMVSNGSILPKVRNEITMRFMASGFDKLLFLDTDMVFNAVDVFKLLNSSHDLCAIDYPKKNDKYETVCTLTGKEKGEWQQASAVGTGLFCVTRDTVAAMQQLYPETRYVTEDGEVCFALFDFMVHNGQYCGEDYTFCRRWVEGGGNIEVLKDAKTKHIGTKAYEGKA